MQAKLRNITLFSLMDRRKKMIFLMCLTSIVGLIYVRQSYQSLKTFDRMRKPAYRLLEPNTDYTILAQHYPDIEPVYPNVVPDIVHYMQFLHTDASFFFYLSVKSVVKFHKPALIMIHCDCDNLTGKKTKIKTTK